jgi:hypothetical protein
LLRRVAGQVARIFFFFVPNSEQVVDIRAWLALRYTNWSALDIHPEQSVPEMYESIPSGFSVFFLIFPSTVRDGPC